MIASPDPLSLPHDKWPAPDRAALVRALTPDHDLTGEDGSAIDLRPDTLVAYIQNYGQWLEFLRRNRQLDPAEQPGARVTPGRIAAWRRENKSRGLAPVTRRTMLRGLRTMLQHIAPEGRWGFVTRLYGLSLKRSIPGQPRGFVIRDVLEVFKHVRRLNRDALAAPDSPERRRDLRDAALLGLLLTRAPRIGSIVRMEIGLHVSVRNDSIWAIYFPPKHTKTHQTLRYALDQEASAMLSDYLEQARQGFPQADRSDCLWLGMKGPLMRGGLQLIMRRRTLAWFGEAHGPHICRKWLRAAAARRSPELAFDVAMVLGHSAEVSAEHYAEASSLHAAMRYGDRLAERRARLKSRTQRESTEAPSR